MANTPKTRDERASELKRMRSMFEGRRSWVLLIDDDREMRSLLADALRDEGYRVLEAGDGTEVLERFRLEDPSATCLSGIDVIVTDVRMAGMGGIELLTELRDRDWTTSVIVISAFADEAVYADAERLGAVAVFAKPFGLKEFIGAVRDAAPLH